MTHEEFDQLWLLTSLLPGVEQSTPTVNVSFLKYKGLAPWILYFLGSPEDTGFIWCSDRTTRGPDHRLHPGLEGHSDLTFDEAVRMVHETYTSLRIKAGDHHE